MIFVVSLLLIVLAVLLLRQASRRQKDAGLPAGRVIYADNEHWNKNTEALYDPQLRLTGKPDYIIQEGETLIPVEIKSGASPSQPYDGHIYQLAAYCLLIERLYGKRPPYGVLHYRNRTYAIDYTTELENRLLDLIDKMQRQSNRIAPDRSHEHPQRCRNCGYRSTCDQKLV